MFSLVIRGAIEAPNERDVPVECHEGLRRPIGKLEKHWEENFARYVDVIKDDFFDEEGSMVNHEIDEGQDVEPCVFEFLKDIYKCRLSRRTSDDLLKSFNTMLVGLGRPSTTLDSWKRLDKAISKRIPRNQKHMSFCVKLKVHRAYCSM